MSTTNTAPRERVKWEQFEVDLLAQAVVEARVRDPFENSFALLTEAQKDILEEHRQREISGWNQAPEVRLKVAELWKTRMEISSPEPSIVHVETQRPPDYVDMLNQLDTPSLVAMLVAKLSKEWQALRPLLTMMNGHTNGHTEAVGAALNPPVSLLVQASAKPRKTRVLICGPFKAQFQEIENKAAEEHLPVELLWLDKDKNVGSIPVTTDYVIVTKFTSHSMHDTFKAAIPKGRFFYLEGGITAVVQKLRDIGSLLPPRA